MRVKFIDNSKRFKKNQYGNNVFYPRIYGSGYIIPDKNKHDEILEALDSTSWFYYALLVITGFIIGALTAHLYLSILTAIIFFIPSLLIIGYVYNRIFIYPKIKGLTPSPDKLKISDGIVTIVCMTSYTIYIVSLVIFLLSLIDELKAKTHDADAIAYLSIFISIILASLGIKYRYRKIDC